MNTERTIRLIAGLIIVMFGLAIRVWGPADLPVDFPWLVIAIGAAIAEIPLPTRPNRATLKPPPGGSS